MTALRESSTTSSRIPTQFDNRWDDPAVASLRSDLVADLYDNLPPSRIPRLTVEAPA